MLHIIGNGRGTQFWLDRWHCDGVLVKRHGEVIRHSSGQSRHCYVVDILDDWMWQPGMVGSSMLRDVGAALTSIEKLPMDRHDAILWIANSNGLFSTKSAWSTMRQQANSTWWSSVVWCSDYVPKHSFVAWRALWGKLPTQSLLRRYGILNVSQCVFCWNHTKDLENLLFLCPFSTNIWIQMLKQKKASHKKARSLGAEAEWILKGFRRMLVLKTILKLAFNATIYNLWLAQNQRRFGDQVWNAIGICNDISIAVFTRSSRLKASGLEVQ